MKRLLSLLLFFTFVYPVLAQDISENHLIFNYPNLYLAQGEDEDIDTSAVEQELLEQNRTVKGITPAKQAFFKSLLIPGWGQLSNGSYIKAAAFVGIEIFTIVMWSNYRGKGKDKEDEYESFADAHYDSTAYLRWLDGYKDVFLHGSPQRDTLPEMFSHKWWPDSLDGDGRYEVEDEQQYYEMIGKYQQFYMGWDDNVSDSARENHYASHYPNKYNSNDYVDGQFIGYDSFVYNYKEHYYLSKNALIYMEMREKSNDYFSQSKNMLGVVFLNHLSLIKTDSALVNTLQAGRLHSH